MRLNSRAIEVFRGRDFRLLWGGQFVSLLGDQFFLVALPWLVLQLTGDPLAIGTVLAVTAAPRAVFILLGGVLIDRFSPRTMMLYSNVGRMVVVAILAVLTATGSIRLWMLYPFGFLLGLGYALFLPSLSAIIPRLVPHDRLQIGNAVIQGTSQLTLFVGPVVAGFLIASLGHKGIGAAAVPQASGIAIVFGLDSVGFLVSAITLALIAFRAAPRDATTDATRSGLLRSLGEGLAGVWRDKIIRDYLVLIGAVNLLMLGPLSVGIPILSHTRFRGGALAYGVVLSGLGAGALTGIVLGASRRRPRSRVLAASLLGSCALLGVGLSVLGAVPSAASATAATFLIGLAEGYLVVVFITWLQHRTPREELGRMMSILLFASVGQAPLSSVVAGVLMRFSVSWVMIAAGIMIVLVGAIAALSPSVWLLGEPTLQPVAGSAGEGSSRVA